MNWLVPSRLLFVLYLFTREAQERWGRVRLAPTERRPRKRRDEAKRGKMRVCSLAIVLNIASLMFLDFPLVDWDRRVSDSLQSSKRGKLKQTHFYLRHLIENCSSSTKCSFSQINFFLVFSLISMQFISVELVKELNLSMISLGAHDDPLCYSHNLYAQFCIERSRRNRTLVNIFSSLVPAITAITSMLAVTSRTVSITSSTSL